MEIEKILNLAREKFDKIPLVNPGVCITLYFFKYLLKCQHFQIRSSIETKQNKI